MLAVLKAAEPEARSCGVFIGQGLAEGLRSQIGAVQAAAAALAAAADAAIRAKARIASPAKTTIEDGKYLGLGLVKGMKNTIPKVRKMAARLIDIPQISEFGEMKLCAASGNIGLDESFIYDYDANYTIIVPVEIDGKETARVIAPYTEEELNKLQKRDNRKHGYR